MAQFAWPPAPVCSTLAGARARARARAAIGRVWQTNSSAGLSSSDSPSQQWRGRSVGWAACVYACMHACVCVYVSNHSLMLPVGLSALFFAYRVMIICLDEADTGPACLPIKGRRRIVLLSARQFHDWGNPSRLRSPSLSCACRSSDWHVVGRRPTGLAFVRRRHESGGEFVNLESPGNGPPPGIPFRGPDVCIQIGGYNPRRWPGLGSSWRPQKTGGHPWSNKLSGLAPWEKSPRTFNRSPGSPLNWESHQELRYISPGFVTEIFLRGAGRGNIH